MMELQKTPEARVGRRQRPRLRLGVAAQLTTLHGAQKVILDDLSLTGAQVRLSDPEKFSSGVLEWLEFDALVDVIWQDGCACGLKFDPPIPQDYILATRLAAPEMLDEKAHIRSAAKRWIDGTAG